MLLRLHFLAAVCFSSVAASFLTHPTSNISTSQESRHLYRIDIPCSQCAFAETPCSQEPEPRSYITLDLSTENNTLYVNHEPIFPSALPLQFPAVKHWKTGKQPVTVAYGINIQPLPSQPGALLDHTLHILLKLRLFDQHGRPVTPSSIVVGLANHKNTLRIIKVERSPFLRHGHSSSSPPSPWKLIKNHIQPYLDALTGPHDAHHRPGRPHRRPPGAVAGVGPGAGAGVGADADAGARPRLSPASHYHNTMPWSSRDRSFMRLVRPVILPALLGITAGLCVCLVGFVAGKLMIAVYRRWYPRRQISATWLELVAVDEESFLAEKESLVQATRWLSV